MKIPSHLSHQVSLLFLVFVALGSSAAFILVRPSQPIFRDNEVAFRPLQTTRYFRNQSSLNVIDVVELLILDSTAPQIENFLRHGSGQHHFAVDVTSVYGGFFVTSEDEPVRSLPSMILPTFSLGKIDSEEPDEEDLLILARVKFHPSSSPSTLLTVSEAHLVANDSTTASFYRPLLTITATEDRILIEYLSNRDFLSPQPIRIPIPMRIIDDRWHSLVIHWNANNGNEDKSDDFYVWVDCQLIYQGVALRPPIFDVGGSWMASVGVPTLPGVTFIDEPAYFAARRLFSGLLEQLVISRDVLFWQSDEQCRYQRETSAVKNNCPICTSPTFLANNPIKTAQTKLLSAIGRNKQKLSQEFETIKEQLDAALRRIEFLEHFQKRQQEIGDLTDRCFDVETGRYFSVNATWSSSNCTRHCTCVSSDDLKPQSVRTVCTSLRCSPYDVADCPPFPFGNIAWDSVDGCCPRCERRVNYFEESLRKSGRSCIRWHRASSLPHGASYFIRLGNDTCAEKRCIDGREIVVRQGPKSSFCGKCLKSASVQSIMKMNDNPSSSRQVCCSGDAAPCKIRSCLLNSSSACDIPERASCEDTAEDIVCRCRPGFIGDGERCIDVDECQESSGSRFSSNCSEHELCINTPGSFYCMSKSVGELKLATLSSNFRTKLYAKSSEGLPKCNEESEILVRYSLSTNMCHCLPGFARLRPSILQAFVRENLPSVISFSQYNVTTPTYSQRCFDIDECQQNVNACSGKHQCANIPGSYVCISASYPTVEAHEIKFSANARRSAHNCGSRFTNSLNKFSLVILLFRIALLVFQIRQ